MTPVLATGDLIAKPLDAIARLRVELRSRADNALPNDDCDAQMVAAISEALCSGASPALDEVPVLSRESFAEVRLC